MILCFEGAGVKVNRRDLLCKKCGGEDLFHGDDDEGEVVLEGTATEGGDLFADGGEEVGGCEGRLRSWPGT